MNPLARRGAASPLLRTATLLAAAAAAVAQDPGAVPAPAPTQEPARRPAEPQDPERLQGGQGRPVIVTASRTEQDPFDAPYSVSVVGQDQMERRSYRTTPQALREVPSVLVQETSPGQGSPFIRGFTGYNTLLLIDGVRLNNSTFRSGPNQYWNTVDPLSLDRLEIVKGPASALYGSDAVGGTVQAFTKSPYAWVADGAADRTAVAGSSFVRYATGENSIMGRGELSIGQSWRDGARSGVLIGGDVKPFDDMEGGHSTGTMPNTGYEEDAFDVKFEHWFSDDAKLVFLHQYLEQDDVPRTHATVFGKSYAGSTVGTDLQRDLDQQRQLTYLQYHRTGLDGLIESARFNFSWHQQDETEVRIPSNGREQQQGFEVDTLGAWMQLESDAGEMGRIAWGVEYWRDDVDSFFRRLVAPLPSDDIQGPVADDASYDLLGLYVQDTIPFGDAAELTVGGRYTYASADADEVRDPATNGQFGIHDSWDQFTGNARLRVDLVENRWNVFGGASQGFRAPNLSDLSSFGVARSGEAEIPSPGLSPEKYIGYEVGTKYASKSFTAQAAYYYTDIDDQILRFPTGAVNASGQPIVTKSNVGDGYVEGVEVEAGVEAIERTWLFGAFTWQYGRVSNFESGGATKTEEFISRLMPVTTIVGARWTNAEDRVWVETLVMRAEDADKTSAGDDRDTQRIPPGGTPGYTLWNVHAGWRVTDRASLDVGIDNVTDVDYRVHGSGSNGIGRSFVLGMRVSF